MIRLFHVYFPSRTLLLAASETALVVLALMAAAILRFRGDIDTAFYEYGSLKICVSSAVLMLCMYYYDLYDSSVLRSIGEVLTRLVQVLGTASVLLAVVYYAYPDVQLGRGPFFIWIVLVALSLTAWRRLFFALNRSSHLKERTVLLGEGPLAHSIAAEIEGQPELGLRLLGYVGKDANADDGVNGLRCLGKIEELADLVERERISRIILSLSERRGRLPVEMLLRLKARGIAVQDAGEIYEAMTGRVSLDSFRPSQLLFSDNFRLSRFTLVYKRLASIVFSVVGLLVSFPLMMLIALAIRLDSRGPAIFRQKRVGQDGKAFTLYKFRSMWDGADGDGSPRPAGENDKRVTRVGRCLRRLRLDELPQLYNILRGDMSFIGPRPFVPATENELLQAVPFYSQRWMVKPGATGWAQIRRGYCATLEDNIAKFGYDLFYIKNISFGLDCLILFETIKILILGRGGR